MTTLRHATSADADAIGRIQVETWTAAYAGLLPEETIDAFDVTARQALWREGLARTPQPGSATFVALVEDEIVGFASVGASHSEDGTGEVYAIYVDPSSWGRGAGRALIERAEASLRDSGFPEALLWVLRGNERGERFYRAAGWEHDGEKEDVFQGATVTELRFRKQLPQATAADKPEVLFVCVHNAGRSQMAAGLLELRAGGRISVRSAGSDPGGEVNPVAVEAMKELGVDLSRAFPKPLTDEAVRAADVVVTMGCGDACPIYPGRRYEDWTVDDPSGQDLDSVRRIRDEIDARVQTLIGELLA